LPVVTVPIDLLTSLVGKKLADEELLRVLTEMGCDVEDIDNINRSLKLNLLPARPDMFDVCGLARSIKGYLALETGMPEYRFENSGVRIYVKPGLENIRQYIVGMVVRNLQLNQQWLQVLMDLQENLHWGLGRNRHKASIGIYDLDTVEPDFVYQPVTPQGISFVPLGETTPKTPTEILTTHPKGLMYQHLLTGYPAYPLLTDKNGVVLSMPPIINSEATKVKPGTQNLFIDVTGSDEQAIIRTLNVISAVFADLTAQVQQIEIIYPDGKKLSTPKMTPEIMELDLNEVKKVIGVELRFEHLIELLHRMRFTAGKTADENLLKVFIPAYRTDVMHPWDIIEDIAIAYGYHNLEPKLIPTATQSKPARIEEFCCLCRTALTGMGFIEVLSLILTSPEAQFEKLGLSDDGKTVVVENPISVEQRILRRHLLAGIVETLGSNSTQPLPQSIFELGDVFVIDRQAETGAQPQRHLALGIADAKASFADVKAGVEALTRELDLKIGFVRAQRMPFLSGRCAMLVNHEQQPVGYCGETHPQVLERFGLTVPVVMAELNLSSFL